MTNGVAENKCLYSDRSARMLTALIFGAVVFGASALCVEARAAPPKLLDGTTTVAATATPTVASLFQSVTSRHTAVAYVAPHASSQAAPTDPVGMAIANSLRTRDAQLRAGYVIDGYKPVWLAITTEGGISDSTKATALLAAIRAVADAHALPLRRYGLDKLHQRLRTIKSDLGAVAQLERDLSRAFILAARDLHGGVLEPQSIAQNIDVDRPQARADSLINEMRTNDDPRAIFESLAPQSADYKSLKRLWKEFREIARQGGWGPPLTLRTLRPGDSGPLVAALRQRFVRMEMIAAATPAVESDQPAAPVVAMFDTELETAVRAFQARNGLKSDGVVGANTYAALNATAASRAAQIAVNMEQARWRNRPLGRKYILVNIPDFHVDVVEDGRIALRSRVIVGKARKHQTPEFSDEITHMVVNPRWNVPHSIASEEFLPELQSDPGALRRRNISIYSPRGGVVDPLSVDWSRISQETFPFSMAQSPGPGNALGNVKFMFPNRYAVYLHDTPGRSLFQRSMRAFSHGCVRVAKPRELAEVLLRPQSNDPRGRFEFLRSKPGEQYERLKQTVPVHIVYRTAWIDAQGDVQLRRDIYGRDQKIAAALARVGLTL